MKKFMFLYPIPEYINFEISKGAYGWRCPVVEKNWRNIHRGLSEQEQDSLRKIAIKEKEARFSYQYSRIFNKCIEQRYRQKSFEINWVIFKGHSFSKIVDVHNGDRILEADIDFKTHTTRLPDGSYTYPDIDFVLNQMGQTDKLRIAGFHIWDCVEKFAKRAYERGLDVMVDEDLTELLTFKIELRAKEFRTDKYPTYNPRETDEEGFAMFMEQRRDCPWLYQNY